MIALLLVTHFVADFLLQSREMGKNKSSNLRYLGWHLAIQFGAFTTVLALTAGPQVALEFSLANAAIHGIIDWHIWRFYKLYAYHKIKATAETNQGRKNLEPEVIAMYAKDFQYWEDHWFYSTIGFDQLLHGLTLVFLAGAFHL